MLHYIFNKSQTQHLKTENELPVFLRELFSSKGNCSKSVFSHASTSTDAPLPMVTPSVWVLKVMRGSSGPGAGQTTNGEEGAAPQSTVGGYWAPDGGTLQGWINWRPERKKLLFQWLCKKSNHLLVTAHYCFSTSSFVYILTLSFTTILHFPRQYYPFLSLHFQLFQPTPSADTNICYTKMSAGAHDCNNR